MNARLDTILRAAGWAPARIVVTPLKGGITNQNFKLEMAGASFVLKLDGKGTRTLGINRENEYACAAITSKLGIGPEVYHFLPQYRSLVTRFIDGEPVSPKAAGQPAMLKRIVASIKLCHGGPPFPGKFSPFHTVRWYYNACRGRGVPDLRRLPDVFHRMKHIEMALSRHFSLCPCHNDLLASNFIDDGKTIRILDWEYAAMGDPFFDLGNFAVNQQLTQERRRLLLKDYLGAVRPRDLARLNLYRLASDLREAFWGFLQATISDVKFDFQAYGVKHLDRFLRGARGPQFERWLKEAAS